MPGHLHLPLLSGLSGLLKIFVQAIIRNFLFRMQSRRSRILTADLFYPGGDVETCPYRVILNVKLTLGAIGLLVLGI